MTLVVVLMYGLGLTLCISAIETDKATGRSVSLRQTIADIWNDRVDFSQSGTNGGAAGGGVVYQPPSPSTRTLTAYQQAATADYLRRRAV